MPLSSGGGPERSLDQIAIDLAVRLLLLGALLWLASLLLQPFMAVLIWSAILAVAFYPAYDWLNRRLGGRPRLASLLLTLAFLLVTVGPATLLLSSLAVSLEHLGERLHAGGLVLPAPPAALRDVPFLGDLTATWTTASANFEGFLTRHSAELLTAGGWLLVRVEGIAGSLTAILLGVVVAGFLYAPGPRLQRGVRRFARRVSGAHGSTFVDLAAATIRNVARGVIGVAMIQTVLVGLALIVADVPGAGLLALATLVLCIIQIGALPVVLPILAWAWLTREATPALILTLYLLPCALSDNLLKPLLMGKGLEVPIIVILMGVIGGTLAFGLIGLFLGPVVLAVLYDLALFWLAEDEDEADGEADGGIE
ncbi:putative PurR-regulated permease PerM [Amaricoccus macauensis]|uniref:Putative PurR-regulated permease PerM n=1 Tax=Amaricoccus macauensis TaxID=57001 RepID=A0A840SXJ1_9RHOB|nr:AI-2E family transporter [Amaricoccus macauensis]MBB5223933.1 putative PurR-regulated permease PerM [Amaricoccus macauensis]